MERIKLSAINSTNDYLKALITKQYVPHFTVVTAETQTQGRGQMGTQWTDIPGKNLICSILVKDVLVAMKNVFDLNCAVSVAIYRTLKYFSIPQLSIKWPNDIMSGNYKIGGILIENSFKKDQSNTSIIGIGINCNQEIFENLPKASSLKNITKQDVSIEMLLEKILESLQQTIATLYDDKNQILRQQYEEILFKRNVPAVFEDEYQRKFMGIIKGVDTSGKLILLDEYDELKTFDLKTIKMLY